MTVRVAVDSQARVRDLDPPPERDALVLQHVPMVRRLARVLARRLPPHVDLGDLVSVGIVGLMDAAGRYDVATGVPFDAFARRRVQGAMLDALRELDWAPRSLRRLRRTLDSTVARLRNQLGREPGNDEVAAALGLSPAGFAHARAQLSTLGVAVMRPLDAPGREGASVMDQCVDPDEGPESSLQRAELRGRLAKALLALPDRERRILAMYYGQELTMAEIGRELAICESRVSQLRSIALSRLRVSLSAMIAPPRTSQAAA